MRTSGQTTSKAEGGVNFFANGERPHHPVVQHSFRKLRFHGHQRIHQRLDRGVPRVRFGCGRLTGALGSFVVRSPTIRSFTTTVTAAQKAFAHTSYIPVVVAECNR